MAFLVSLNSSSIGVAYLVAVAVTITLKNNKKGKFYQNVSTISTIREKDTFGRLRRTLLYAKDKDLRIRDRI
jgi:hypothetical protein